MYAKHFLYETDKTWCDAGPGFLSLDIPQLNTRVGVGICMDINPYEYIDDDALEFANFHKQRNTQILVLLGKGLFTNLTIKLIGWTMEIIIQEEHRIIGITNQNLCGVQNAN